MKIRAEIALTDEGQSLDVMLRLLSNPLQRQILITLSNRNIENEGPLPVESALPADSTANERVQMIALHHELLPKLDAQQFIDWQKEENVISPGPYFENIICILDSIEEADIHCM